MRTRLISLVLAGLLCLALTVSAAASSEEPSGDPAGLEIDFLDIGQGDAVLVLCGGQVMLVDGGPSANAERILARLDELGLDHIDILVCTHPHDDHYGGLIPVLAAVPVETVYGSVAESNSQTYASFAAAVQAAGHTIEIPAPGDTFPLGDALVEVIGPIKETRVVNDQSLVLRITYGQRVFLLVGDAGITEMEDIREAGFDVTCDLLKTGHHGSADSTDAWVLGVTQPDYVVISCGTNNRFGLPDDSVLAAVAEAGAELYRTDTDGTIIMSTDGQTIRLTHEKVDYPAADASGEAS